MDIIEKIKNELKNMTIGLNELEQKYAKEDDEKQIFENLKNILTKIDKLLLPRIRENENMRKT